MGFGQSVRNGGNRQLREVNSAIISIATELYTTITYNTPIGTSITKGQLINNWHLGIGKNKINRNKTSSFNVSGISSYNEIAKLKGSTEFLGKNGEVSFSNSVHYAFRAEYAGWPQPKWSGRILPGASYGMVRNSLTAIAAKHRT
jgi:hypothetical protein